MKGQTVHLQWQSSGPLPMAHRLPGKYRVRESFVVFRFPGPWKAGSIHSEEQKQDEPCLPYEWSPQRLLINPGSEFYLPSPVLPWRQRFLSRESSDQSGGHNINRWFQYPVFLNSLPPPV